MKLTPNVRQHLAYSIAFDHFNKCLFEGALPQVMLTLTRDENALKGYFMEKAWHDNTNKQCAEISLNANSMNNDIYALMNVLIHEMIHLWQFTFGSPDKGSHNEEFAVKCEELGLTFEKDRVGKYVQTHIGDSGPALEAVMTLPEKAIFPFMSHDKGTSSPPKWHPIPVPIPVPSKPEKQEPVNNYACPICGLLAKAKPGSHLVCGICTEPLIEEVQK